MQSMRRFRLMKLSIQPTATILSPKFERESDVVIGMAGMYGSYSEWMKWEIETAKSIGKPVIAVVPWGQERVSSIIAGQAGRIVRWNTESIVSAIRELA